VQLPGSSAQVLQGLAARERDAGLRWSGLVEAGYRFVHVAGARNRYETDLDLEPGLRLRSFEGRGIGSPASAVSEVSLLAHDLGDPRWAVEGRARADDAWDLGSRYSEGHYLYDASGDYHRVDQERGESLSDAELQLDEHLRAFASFRRASEDSYWITQRIGNRSLPVQTVIDGVESPRRYDGDETEAGLTGEVGDWRWNAAVQYLGERTVDHWLYSQPATGNPAFVESEDTTARATLRGPGARVGLAGDAGPLSLDFAGRWFDHERRVAATGTTTGFDLAEFTTVTTGAGGGTARTWLLDGSATLELCEPLRLVADLHWRDHDEDLALQQTDVTTYPSLGTQVTVTTNAVQQTSHRLLDGALQLDWSVDPELELSVGWGFAREWLEVTDLDPLDPRDFVSGSERDDGLLAGVRWRPHAEWTLRADLRAFGLDGVPLHELVPERAQEEAISLQWHRDDSQATVFVRHRRNENDFARHHFDALTAGLTAGVRKGELEFAGSYVFSRLDSSTLTNFYFDPDPNPVPTLVGFDGDTHAVSGTLTAEPSAELRWQFAVVWTKTTGSFDVAVLDWHADLQLRVGRRGAIGCEYRQAWYRDQDAVDDWDGTLVFVYWRQTW
jgi:hypothetical protein